MLSDNKTPAPFLRLEEVASEHDPCDLDANPQAIRAFVKAGLLPVFWDGSHALILSDDACSIIPAVLDAGRHVDKYPLFELDGPKGQYMTLRLLLGDTRINLPTDSRDTDPTFYPALRNLLCAVESIGSEAVMTEVDMQYFLPTRIRTSSAAVYKYASAQDRRARRVSASKASQFASSAYYMGSKQALAGFLVEAISSALPQNGVVVDLMCGSGAAAGAFSKIWRTFASDAQEFCRILALVQGAGFSVKKANVVLEFILSIARSHAKDLMGKLEQFLAWEDAVFHGDIGPDLLLDYQRFISALPTYPELRAVGSWRPSEEVEKRKADPTTYPYCLFTAYFANVYFGLRQCIEIDSLRYAIDQIKDRQVMDWALGALIASLSKVGATYGGHFAQPLVRRIESLSMGRLSQILEKRAFSIFHEFSVRLLNLSDESEKSEFPVEIIDGPWPTALSVLDPLLSGEAVVVYLDAPYTREEYSRFYHVLETAVLYSYPSAVGVGKIPDKRKGERFSSEFFTKSRNQITHSLVEVIESIVDKRWTCAWSYANTGKANIVGVITEVCRKTGCAVRSYAVPYEHKPQGGAISKKVTEYLIIFNPR
jgi:hypothetical protein